MPDPEPRVVYRLAPVELVDDEQVVWRGRPSWRSMFAFYLRWMTLALLIGIGSEVVERVGDVDLPKRWFWLAAVLLAVITVVVGWLRRVDTLYVITDRRIHIRHGILSRRDHSTRHERIQNVNTDQGLFDRMLNVGTVDFDTAGTDDYEFRFAGVHAPGELVRLVARVQSALEDAPPAERAPG